METFRFVGETLRLLRKREGRTIEDVAVAAGAGKSQLSRIENGRQEPKLSTIAKILQNLEVSEEDFLRLYLAVARHAEKFGETKPGTPKSPDTVWASEDPGTALADLVASWPVTPRAGHLEFPEFLLVFNIVPRRMSPED